MGVSVYGTLFYGVKSTLGACFPIQENTTCRKCGETEVKTAYCGDCGNDMGEAYRDVKIDRDPSRGTLGYFMDPHVYCSDEGSDGEEIVIGFDLKKLPVNAIYSLDNLSIDPEEMDRMHDAIKEFFSERGIVVGDDNIGPHMMISWA